MKSQTARDFFATGGIVGQSAQMHALSVLLERVASTDAPLLVVGEPGTYKEAFAEAVHQKSRQRNSPFLVVDCAGPDPESLEIELFGDERAASAPERRIKQGVFEAAAGGTVFLGEVGELPGDLQARVLRAIERQQIRRVGAASFISVKTRFIASTSHNLRACLEEKRVREDLYYRLTSLQVRLPPLRERLEDVPELVRSIVVELGLGGSDADALLDPEFLTSLARCAWPGNIRQLRHHIERCNALGDVSLPPSMDTFPSMSGSFRVAPRADSLRMLKAARKV